MDKPWTKKVTRTIPLYKVDIAIIFTTDLPAAAHKYIQVEGKKETLGLEDIAITHTNNDMIHMMFKIRPLSYATIVHESVHAAIAVMNRLGIQAGTDNDEPQSYLTEEIFSMICDVAQKSRVKIDCKK